MPTNEKIRKPAVAGQFYPASPTALREDIENYLAVAKADASAQRSNIVIAPHAGYVFSAPVAAKAYARINKKTKTVILIGPPHHKWFDGIHVTDAAFYETPLGKVEVNRDVVKKLSANPLCLNVRGAEEQEHCLEVHLPFLQAVLDKFTIVPLLAGKVGAKAASEALLPFIDDTTLLIASSDLSHYLPQEKARETDSETVTTILSGKVDGFMDGCGETAMRIAMEIAAKKGLTAELLDARTSYETAPQRCDAERVVGYASIIFIKKDNAMGNAEEFTPQEKKYLLDLARQTLEMAVNGKGKPSAKPDIQRLSQNYGCFVTLNALGHLRGCIGNIEPIKPLYSSVIDNTVNAAFYDPRFTKVKATELGDIKIEISVLTKPEPLESKSPDDLLSKLAPFEHGVILKSGALQSTFLPQVWEQLPDKVLFLEHLAMKAGMEKNEWKRAEVWVYRAEHFSE